jgi:alkylated DNA repair dioxygenase AlkB
VPSGAVGDSDVQQLSLLGESSGGSPTDKGETHPELIERPGLRVRFWPHWLVDEPSWQERLEQEVPWKQDTITLWGRTHPLPRLTCWLGDPGCTYTYSGVRNRIEPWSPAVSELRDLVQKEVGTRFNSLLLNRYRDGRDKLDWHADDEAELDPDAPIASLSLGLARSFRLRPRAADRRPEDTLSFELGGGDLLVMDPPTQRHWLHQVPQRLRLQGARLNLTFRRIRPEAIRHA